MPIRRDVPLKVAALVGCAVTTSVGATINTVQEELISREYTLDEINEAYQVLLSGEVARGVIVFE